MPESRVRTPKYPKTDLVLRPLPMPPESAIFSMRVDGQELQFTILKNRQNLQFVEAPTRYDREDPLA